MVPHIVDPPNALHFCLPLLDPDSQRIVRNWVATGDLKRTEKKKKEEHENDMKDGKNKHKIKTV